MRFAALLWLLLSTAIQASTTCAVQIFWSVVTQNADGTPMSDLWGYRVYEGTSAATLVPIATIAPPYNAYKDSMNVIIPGVYYYAVSAVNSAGVEGALSNVWTLNAATCPAAPGNLHAP